LSIKLVNGLPVWNGFVIYNFPKHAADPSGFDTAIIPQIKKVLQQLSVLSSS